MKPISNKLYNTIMRNGFEYGASSITCMIDNVPFFSLTNISYAETATFENLYGLGNQPVARGISNNQYSASITIRKSEVIALQKAASLAGDTDGSIDTILPFTIIVQFIRPGTSSGGVDTLLDVQFMENNVNVANGATAIDVTIPLIISHIKWSTL